MMYDLDLPKFHSGKTETFNQVEKLKIGKTTNGEHVSTSVQLKENEEDYKASMVQVVEPHIRKQTVNEADGIVSETAYEKAGRPGKRKIQRQCIKKKQAEKVLWIISLIQNVQSVQISKFIIWIILGFLFLGFAGSEQNCTGIGLKVKGTFIEGSTATFTVQKKCRINYMTAAPNGKVLPIVTNGIVEVDYKKTVTSEVSSTGWTITIENLTSSNLSTVYELTCCFNCEKTKRLSQYRKGNRANGMTYDLLLTWLCCLLTCLLWIMH